MKIVAVYFSDPEPNGYPLDTLDYGTGYRNLSELCQQNDIVLYIVRTPASYLGNMRFSHGWKFNNGELVAITTPFTANLIYMKSVVEALKTGPTDVVLNDPELDEICRDKLASYALFSEYMKPCTPITKDNWQAELATLKDGKIVLKPVFGEGGHGIFFVEKADFDIRQIPDNIPYLAQEFTESIEGVPGISKGRHDMRVIIANGTPVTAYVRIAQKDSLFSNASQGATALPVHIHQLPSECSDIIQKVDAQFQRFPFRFYSIDFMYEHGIPYITELNSRPALHSASFLGAEHAENLRQALVSIFKST